MPPDFNEAAAVLYRRPFHMFIVKVASRCNLNCDYCYVYQSPDKSWQSKPVFLAESTALLIAKRIQEHVATHALSDVSIVLHGGEPLLAGVDRLAAYAETFRSTVSCPTQLAIQTNGVLIDARTANLLLRYQFRIGISLDGAREHNDRHRQYHNGSSSYGDVVRAIRLLQSRADYRALLGGVLVVIDVRNPPRDVLAAIEHLGVGSANLLLPDSNYESAPYRPGDDPISYGKWLAEFFDIWMERYPHIEIPYFEEIMNLMMGGVSESEEIAALSVDFIVIDTNGDIEAVDTLKMVGRAATSLGLNVATHRFDDALEHPAIYSRMSGFHALCSTCRDCRFLSNCGGGYLPHRYSAANGFVNPSVYCNDLKHLFDRIRARVFAPLPV